MRSLIIFLTLACMFCGLEESKGAFAAHVRISPENRQKEGFEIYIRSLPTEPDHYYVDILYRDMGTKKYHLILMDKELSPDQQDFRKYASVVNNPEEGSKLATILLKTALQPGEPHWFARSAMGSKDSISLRLHKDTHDKAYIFIDFQNGNLVMDGGYYYTIDLPAFIRDYEKHRKK